MEPADPSRPLRIVLVEDHKDTMICLKKQLERAGHIVMEATCVQEAVSILPDSDCDVLLSDIGLPDGTGWDLPRQANTLLCRPVFAVAMSGYSDDADLIRSDKAGFQHHLVKPFHKTELLDLLQEVQQPCMP
ncbi:MAG: response regulator [Verrucomicrobiaceae bacterium]|nr:MAG: response regulator [Verrucomicrobiaceae bacterium]